MTSSTQYWLVIPATGSGQRMKAERPKQYIEVCSKTILQHTLDNVLSHPKVTGAVLILNSEDKYWKKLDYQHDKTILLCNGGELRQHSVYNGLKRLKQVVDGNPYVLIHDAVRPFVSHTDLDKLIAAVNNSEDGALLAAPVSDTLKLANKNHTVKLTHPRDNLWRAFTPQAFRLEMIMTALASAIKDKLDITDDANAMELMGYHPQLVAGDGQNIKITYPQDLFLAEQLLKPAYKGY